MMVFLGWLKTYWKYQTLEFLISLDLRAEGPWVMELLGLLASSWSVLCLTPLLPDSINILRWNKNVFPLVTFHDAENMKQGDNNEH